MCEYIINIIADKELSGIDVHHIISKITRRSAAHNTGQLDSNAACPVYGVGLLLGLEQCLVALLASGT